LGNPDRPVGPLSAAAYGMVMASFKSAPQGTTTYGNIQAGVWTERYKDWTVNGKHVGSTLISRSFKPLQGGRNPLMEHAEDAVTWEEFKMLNAGCTYDEIVNQLPSQGPGQPGGPRERYVRDPLNKNAVIDMRHMLVIGFVGRSGGDVYEALQSVMFWSPGRMASAFNEQDYYSNQLGYAFFDHEGTNFISWFVNTVWNDPATFMDRLDGFINRPACRGPSCHQ
jgi:hypothetical protein